MWEADSRHVGPLDGVHISAIWRIWWTDLCDGCDAGTDYYCCSKLFFLAIKKRFSIHISAVVTGLQTQYNFQPKQVYFWLNKFPLPQTYPHNALYDVHCTQMLSCVMNWTGDSHRSNSVSDGPEVVAKVFSAEFATKLLGSTIFSDVPEFFWRSVGQFERSLCAKNHLDPLIRFDAMPV